jgi:hypothetical protein
LALDRCCGTHDLRLPRPARPVDRGASLRGSQLVGKKSPFESAIEQHVPAIFELLALQVDGVEVTQAIQYYRAEEHLSDPADRGPDNSVRLVAGKPAWVRVYVRSGLGGPLTGVTGNLLVRKRHLGFLWDQVANLSPQPPGTVTAEWDPDYATERSTLGASLNFILPADLMCGHLRLDVRVEAPGSGYQASMNTQIDVTLRQTLRLKVIPFSYDGDDGTGTGTLQLPAPDLPTAQATAAWSLLVYPVRSTPVIELTAAMTLTFPLTGSPASPGGCAQSWLNFNALAATAKAADGNQANTIYYALAPNMVPIGTNSGCESGGISSGLVGGQVTMAHEIGHGLGFQHAPCGGVGASADPNFPAYEPYDAGGVPGASIGEYGLDISAGTIHSPATQRDFMAYCAPRWISLYNYERSIEHALFDPTPVCRDDPWWWDEALYDPFWWLRPPEPPEWFDEVIVNRIEAAEPVISVVGIRHATGELEIRSVTRTHANPTVTGGAKTDLVVELVDEQGARTAAAPVFRLQSSGDCGCGEHPDDERGSWIFQAFVPDVAKGSALRVLRGGETLWERHAPERPPAVERFDARVARSGLVVAWRLGKDDQDCEVWLRRTGGRSAGAQVVHIARGSAKATLDIGLLPPGKDTLELVVHDGFHVTTSEPVTLEVPTRPPAVAILHPLNRQTLRAEHAVRLHGLATSGDGEPVAPKRCRWLLDGEDVGTGLDVWITAPAEGEHKVTLVAEDRFGRSERTVVFQTVEAGLG